jgi:hypothetical protein
LSLFFPRLKIVISFWNKLDWILILLENIALKVSVDFIPIIILIFILIKLICTIIRILIILVQENASSLPNRHLVIRLNYNIFVFDSVTRWRWARIKDRHINILCWLLLAVINVSYWCNLCRLSGSIWMVVGSCASHSVTVVHHVQTLLWCYMEECFLHQWGRALVDSWFLLDCSCFFWIIWLIENIGLWNYVIFMNAILMIFCVFIEVILERNVQVLIFGSIFDILHLILLVFIFLRPSPSFLLFWRLLLLALILKINLLLLIYLLLFRKLWISFLFL